MNIRRSVWVTLLASNAGMVIGFLSSLVLARLLTPADIGAFSIAVVLVNLVAVFRDLGTQSYLVQRRTLDSQDLGAALGLTLFTGALLALALLAASGPFARWYGQHEIQQVLWVLTASFLLVPYVNVLAASLSRELMAGRSATIGLIGTLVHAAVAIGTAWVGAAHLAPAWANLANLGVTVLLSALLAPAARNLRPRLGGWGEPLRFGTGATAEHLLQVAQQSIPDLVLGKTAGTHEVGLFSRAAGLVGLLQQALQPTIQYTAGPVLARSHHADQPLGPLLAQGACLVTAVAWPALALMALFAAPLIGLLYGPVWLPAAPLVAWLALSAAARLPWALAAKGLHGIGRPGLAALAVGANVLARGAVLLAFAHGGLQQFAMLLALADLLALTVTVALARRHLGYGLRQALRANAGSAAVALACAGAAWGAWQASGAAGLPAGLAAIAAVAAALGGWWAAARAVGHPALAELQRLRPGAQSSRA